MAKATICLPTLPCPEWNSIKTTATNVDSMSMIVLYLSTFKAGSDSSSPWTMPSNVFDWPLRWDPFSRARKCETVELRKWILIGKEKDRLLINSGMSRSTGGAWSEGSSENSVEAQSQECLGDFYSRHRRTWVSSSSSTSAQIDQLWEPSGFRFRFLFLDSRW